VGAGKRLDPNVLSAMMPASLSFSADDAQSLVSSTAAVLDIAGMRRGIAPGELFQLLVKPGAAAPPIAEPASTPAPTAEVAGLRKQVTDLEGRLASAEEKSSKMEARFETRLKKLGV